MIRILKIFGLHDVEPEEVATSQARAFIKQIPFLYSMLIANTSIIAFIHFGVVPNFLSVWLPLLMNIFCVMRLCVWINNRQKEWKSDNSIRLLKSFRIYSFLLTALVFTWALLLAAYGNTETRPELSFFAVLTINTISICQLQVRSNAMLALLCTVFGMILHWYFFSDTYTFLRTVEETVCVWVLIVTLNIHYKSFVDLVIVQKSLLNKNVMMKNLSDENFRIANQDSLTNIANRRLFFHTLNNFIKDNIEKNGSFTMGLVDLDGFKTVNDIYGHSVGDELLKAAAIRLQDALGPEAFVARLGGDEFALILPDTPSVEEIEKIGRSMQDALGTPFQIDAVSAQVSGSIGFAIFPEAGNTQNELYDRADHALYYAKTNARGTAVIFSSEHEKAIRRKALIEQNLRSTDFLTELYLVYQPIVSIATNRTVAFEALARWTSPSVGSISPGEFIPLAEKIDLIGPITVALFRKALADLVQWPPEIRLSFNLSARDVVSPTTILKLIALIAEFEVNAARIDFEVTETALLHDFDVARRSIATLESLGAKIVLDDFGTGYSSLAYVNRLSLDKIKVDQSFTRQIETDINCRNIVHSIIKLCHTLSLGCVVEGIETIGQADIIRNFDCDYFQGYFFARPMPADCIPSFLAEPSDLTLQHTKSA